MNSEHYSDPTAEIAVGHKKKKWKPSKEKQLVTVFKIIADLCGYRVVGRVTLEKIKVP